MLTDLLGGARSPFAVGDDLQLNVQELYNAINVLTATGALATTDKLAAYQAGGKSATVQQAYNAINVLAGAAALAGADKLPTFQGAAAVAATLTQVLTFITANQTTMLNLNGSAFTIVGGSTSSTTNGTNLVAAYAAAKLATPHGAALSLNNRFTIFLLPGVFTLTGDALVLDTQFIDLVGLSTNSGSMFWDTSGFAGLNGGDIQLQSTGNTLGLNTGANNRDVTVANLSLLTSTAGTRAFNPTATGTATKLINVFIQNTSAQTNKAMVADVVMDGYYEDVRCWNTGSFASQVSTTANATGTFVRCKAAQAAFGANLGGSSGAASGVFIDCEADGASFGAQTAGGTFVRCRFVNVVGTGAGMFGFGSGSSANGLFIDCDTAGNASSCFGAGSTSGTFFNCRCPSGAFSAGGAGTTYSGSWINCVGGDNSFGGGGSTASGSWRNCVGGNGSFGGSTATGGTASGTFYNCVGGNGSFGGGVTTGGTASGTFRYCTGGTNCYGSGGTTNGTLSGTVVDCSMLGHCRISLTGKLEGMRIEATAANTSALQVATGSTGAVYNCTIVGTGAGLSIDVISGTPTIAIAHCRTNKTISASITNSIGTPYNVDDAQIV